ncbi:MAG: hypothetical protein Q9162_007364 [Coniocarpon cinnabarinum]
MAENSAFIQLTPPLCFCPCSSSEIQKGKDKNSLQGTNFTGSFRTSSKKSRVLAQQIAVHSMNQTDLRIEIYDEQGTYLSLKAPLPWRKPPKYQIKNSKGDVVLKAQRINGKKRKGEFFPSFDFEDMDKDFFGTTQEIKIKELPTVYHDYTAQVTAGGEPVMEVIRHALSCRGKWDIHDTGEKHYSEQLKMAVLMILLRDQFREQFRFPFLICYYSPARGCRIDWMLICKWFGRQLFGGDNDAQG